MNLNTMLVEGLIFIAGDAGITLNQLCESTQLNKTTVSDCVKTIKAKHENSDSPLVLVNYGEKYHFITKPECFDSIAHFLQLNKVQQLSQSALETLAIIAYKQPITRIEIEEVRGVSCEVILRKLASLDLICEAGRLETPGRPILYEVTATFLDTFKMISLNELPEITIQQQAESEDFYQ